MSGQGLRLVVGGAGDSRGEICSASVQRASLAADDLLDGADQPLDMDMKSRPDLTSTALR
jgi:hypothetical protein